MSHATILTMIIGIITAVGGGGFGAWLTYLRLAPKASAEAHDITAAARDKDWARFHREIDRLVKRCEKAERRAEDAIAGQHECEQREIALKGRLATLEAIVVQRGEDRRLAAGIVAADRLASEGGAK